MAERAVDGGELGGRALPLSPFPPFRLSGVLTARRPLLASPPRRHGQPLGAEVGICGQSVAGEKEGKGGKGGHVGRTPPPLSLFTLSPERQPNCDGDDWALTSKLVLPISPAVMHFALVNTLG